MFLVLRCSLIEGTGEFFVEAEEMMIMMMGLKKHWGFH